MDIHHELISPTLRTTSRMVAEKFDFGFHSNCCFETSN